MLNKRIEKITIGIIEDSGIKSLPIPVDEIAKKRGLSIKPYDLGDKIWSVSNGFRERYYRV